MPFPSSRPTRRRLLQGGLALGTYSLAPRLPVLAQTREPRILTAGPGEAQLLSAGQPATPTWLYDGVSPGPTIRVRQGEEVLVRSEESRVGKEWVRTCRSRWSPGH